ncbi:MAG: DNA polymerase I [Micavibrio aeruginosavorus]|nr:DNA polymerase I [Micavibrio aeruginosavorus]
MTNAQLKTSTAEDEIYLVDGSGYIFRAYYALPQNLTNPQGVPVGAVLGFVNMLLKLLTDLHAPAIAVIFDAARKNYRNDIYPEYKANRSETPEDLIPQFPLIREATRAFDIPGIELEGYEADDLIATYARLAREQGKTVTIVGTDKDLMQLVRPGVRMYDPIKGRYLDENDVIEKFGVTPDKVIDVQSLVGDSTDNIPGVPGIGVKTAAQLIAEYGDLDTLLARAGEIKQPKRRETLIEYADTARMSRQLVTLHQDVPVPYALSDLKAHDPHTQKLADFLKEQGFKSVLTRLGAPANHEPALPPHQGKRIADLPPETAEAPKALPAKGEAEYILIDDLATLEQWLDDARDKGLLCVDTETTSLTPARAKLVGVSLSIVPERAAYIPVGHTVEADLLGDNGNARHKQLPLADVIARLKPVLEDESVLKIGHNIKYDWQIFANYGIRMAAMDDSMLLSYVLDGTQHGHGMDELSELLLAHKTISYEDVTGKGKNQVSFDKVDIAKACDYAAEDAEITLRLHQVLKPRLIHEHMVRVYEDIERPLIPVIARMEHTGICIDTAFLKSLSHEFGTKLAALEKNITALAGHDFNVGSPKQLGAVLFEEMGMPGGRKTKTGDWSTAVDVLEDLSEQGHEIVGKVLEWRQLSKLKSTYTDSLPEEINPATGRVHTSFNMTGTTTGRLSSSDPNLQNIPIRTEEGRKIRRAFIAEPGWKLLSVDYSQVELRLAAALADVKALKQAFIDKVDIHTMTASQVFGIPLDQVTPEIRRSAKAVNFGIIYGISGFGLAKQLNVSVGEASDFIRRYLNKFHEIQDYMEACKEEARQHGYVRTYYGRKCFIPNINSKNGAWRSGAERQAINAPLQGTAADIMKMAMARMPSALGEAGLSARMLLQVHDELVFEVPSAEIEKTAEIVKTVMREAGNVGIPLEAEAGWADNWADAH